MNSKAVKSSTRRRCSRLFAKLGRRRLPIATARSVPSGNESQGACFERYILGLAPFARTHFGVSRTPLGESLPLLHCLDGGEGQADLL
jgi:hypothetical protein